MEILRSLSPALLPAKRGRIWCREKPWKGLKASRLGRLAKRASNPIPRNQKRSVASISFHLSSFQRNIQNAHEWDEYTDANGMNGCCACQLSLEKLGTMGRNHWYSAMSLPGPVQRDNWSEKCAQNLQMFFHVEETTSTVDDKNAVL